MASKTSLVRSLLDYLERQEGIADLNEAAVALAVSAEELAASISSRTDIAMLDTTLLSQLALEKLSAKFLDALLETHRRSKALAKVSASDVLKRLGVPMSDAAVEALVQDLEQKGQLIRVGGDVRHADFRPKLSPRKEAFRTACLQLLKDSPLQPPSVAEMAQTLHAPAAAVQETLNQAVAAGEIVRGPQDTYFSPADSDKALEPIQNKLGAKPFGRKEFREAAGLSRKFADPIFELLLDKGRIVQTESGFRFTG